MDVVIDFIFYHKEGILEGVIIAVLSALLLAIISKIIARIKVKFLSKSSEMRNSSEQAIKLSFPQRRFDDNCLGRYELVEDVLDKIKDGKKNLFKRKCIAITGEEGIGKSLFCYTLFQDYLKEYSVYLGWIDCTGKKSIFDIIKTTFEGSQFHRKSKDSILKAFNSINKPCILFVDQVDQYTPIDELEELTHCPNVILIISGLLKNINFADYTFKLQPLIKESIYKIFKKYSGEDIDSMFGINKISVTRLFERYVKGNPFLARAFAGAKYHYNGRWDDVLENMERYEYNDDENYLKKILIQLYKIRELDDVEKTALSKLSTIEYTNFVEVVFDWLDIPDYYAKRLCNTYWLVQEDSIMYFMDNIHRAIIIKVLAPEDNLRNTISAIYNSLSRWKVYKDNGFRWISSYVEQILKQVQGYAPQIMDEEVFSKFAWEIAYAYETIKNNEKCLEWIELCRPKSAKLAFKKAYIEFRAKSAFLDTLFSRLEVEQIYSVALEKAKEIDDFKDNERFLTQEYCFFLIEIKEYDEAILCCKKYFETYDMDLSDEYNCDMFFRYLQIANLLDDEETLKCIVSDAIIHDLYQNDKVSITAAWSFGELGEIYLKWNDKESSDRYMRHMVVLLNEERCFFHNDIKEYLKISDEEFAEYMHSCDELLDSLKNALQREDAEALYIEGRYQEKYGNHDDAFVLYEEAASKGSLRGICSLALLYYRGQGISRNYEKAQKYWEYCCEREHRGSYYWLGILLLDMNYDGYDKESALEKLTKAAELGSERAKQKLSEL